MLQSTPTGNDLQSQRMSQFKTKCCQKILKKGRVALSSGPAFGPEGKGFARLNFATSRKLLTECLERVASVS